MAKSPVPRFLRRKVLAMWVWVIDQLWIFVCIGIAGGIAGAIYQSRRAQVDEETSPTELSKPSEAGVFASTSGERDSRQLPHLISREAVCSGEHQGSLSVEVHFPHSSIGQGRREIARDGAIGDMC